MDTKRIIFCSFISFLIDCVFLINLASWDVCDYKIPSFWDPHIEIIFGCNKLIQQNISIFSQFCCIVFHIGIVRMRYRLQTLCDCILNDIICAKYIILMDWTNTSNKLSISNNPTRPDTCSCEYFTCGINAEGAILHVLLECHFW